MQALAGPAACGACGAFTPRQGPWCSLTTCRQPSRAHQIQLALAAFPQRHASPSSTLPVSQGSRKGWVARVQGCWQAVVCREQPDSPDVHRSPEAVLSGSQLANPGFYILLEPGRALHLRLPWPSNVCVPAVWSRSSLPPETPLLLCFLPAAQPGETPSRADSGGYRGSKAALSLVLLWFPAILCDTAAR